MNSQLENLVAYLAGQPGVESDRLRREMGDPAGTAALSLTALRTRSRQMLSEATLRALGLPAPRQRSSLDALQPSTPRRWRRAIPWALAAASLAAAVFLALDCPRHRQHLMNLVPAAQAEQVALPAARMPVVKAQPQTPSIKRDKAELPSATSEGSEGTGASRDPKTPDFDGPDDRSPPDGPRSEPPFVPPGKVITDPAPGDRPPSKPEVPPSGGGKVTTDPGPGGRPPGKPDLPPGGGGKVTTDPGSGDRPPAKPDVPPPGGSGKPLVFPPPKVVVMVRVPRLTGMEFRQAADTAKKDGLGLRIATGHKGPVLRQSPPAGTEVAPGTVIEVFGTPAPKTEPPLRFKGKSK